MSSDPELIRRADTGDVVLFLGPETAAALAVLLHLVHDSRTSRLSPYLTPLMRLMDAKLVGYQEAPDQAS